MHRATLIYFPLLMILILFSSCRKDESPPNIVFILVDDLGWKDLGCYGSEFYETPNIDLLSSEGMIFTQAYAASPVCSPTRAAIMTGKYPHRVNITDWIPGDDPKNRSLLGPADSNELALSETTLAEALKQNGYKTFFAGKWHLGSEGFYPEEQGFDINVGGHHRGSPPGGYYTPYKNPKLIDGPDGEYLTDRLTNESMAFIKENKEQPFFLYLSFYTVHTPIQANISYVDYYKKKLEELGDPKQEKLPENEAYTTITQFNPAYASMVHSLDVNVGRLLKHLKELGLYENTVVVLTSDNGGLSTISSPNWTAPTSVRPLRAGKGWCYEGGIRVPLIVKAPKTGNGVCNYPVISMDFYPTLLELAGLDMITQQHVDGTSLTPLLKGDSGLERDELYWHYPHYHGSGWTPGAAIRKGPWKLIEFYETGELELYDLENDPGESNNLSESEEELVHTLKKQLLKHQDNTNAQMPKTNPQ